MASSSSYNSPCAACKFLRRKCMPDCIFSPYFPPEEPQKFINVHKIFGASNVTKLLNELLPHQRDDAVNSLAYEAEARVRDPVYGCVGAITFLQRQVDRLQRELDAANADLIRIACSELENAQPAACSVRQPIELSGRNAQPGACSIRHPVELSGRKMGSEGGVGAGGFYQIPPFPFSYSLPWNDINGGERNM